MQTPIESNQLFIDTWKLMCGRLPAPRIQDVDGLTVCYGNVPLPFLNVILANRPVASLGELRADLHRVAAIGRDFTHPWLHLLCEEMVPEGWQAVATETGFQPTMLLTGMTAPALKPPTRSLPELEWRPIRDDQTATDLAQVNAHAYGLPLDMVDCICNRRLWHDDSYGAVGYLDGKPVTGAGAFPVAGTLYVALVATLPEFRGRGFAEAGMRHTIAEASKIMDSSLLALHASEAGLPVYRRMGFESSGVFQLLATGGAAGH